MAKVVVGVDGSESSRAAFRFAVEEARLRGATLLAIHAWELPLRPGEPTTYVAVGEPAGEHDLEAVGRTLSVAASDALGRSLEGVSVEDIDLRPESVEGSPAEVLVEAAKDADVLVVGSRGRGGFRGLVLGSVSQKVAHHSPCPVVIVKASA